MSRESSNNAFLFSSMHIRDFSGFKSNGILCIACQTSRSKRSHYFSDMSEKYTAEIGKGRLNLHLAHSSFCGLLILPVCGQSNGNEE